ncbi:MAG: NAD-dependent deacylase [Chloroflexi bacterium]|nr:NAD-dependent deacylase [Chloroflexota bacterium]MBI5081654.1 NAD-dependent deacylase [Chloroflexota bacterium]MBI5714719.1 NAD-dependent deacylase [Chloroflexota bacterium]
MTYRNAIREAAQLIRQAELAVTLTGAGISTPSGIPDFRSPHSGVWANADPMEVASLQSFRARPELFYEWIKPLARTLLNAKPNPAHISLARLEAAGYLTLVITQNIDMLHERAGSSRVLEVHGNLREATCIHCYRTRPAAPLLERWLNYNDLPRCDACGHVMKPNVILFGEQLPARIFTEAKLVAKQCDVMVVAGSSLEVFPAADLPTMALDHGARLIVINREPTFVDSRAAIVINENVEDVLPMLVDEVLA